MAINTCYGASASTDPVRAVAELAAMTRKLFAPGTALIT